MSIFSSFFSPLDQRRLIFCINSGRSGSRYLSQLLTTADGVNSFHEAKPPMIDDYLQMVTRAPYAESFRARKVKVDAIKATLRKMRGNQVYAESNHMFIKTFFDVVLDAFKNVDVIILRRDLTQVLKSFIELNYFTDKNPNSVRWMSSPNAATAALRAIAPDEHLDQYDRTIAYLLDIEARALRFQREFPNVPTHEVRLESLNEYSAVAELLARLRINPTPATQEMLGERVNPKTHRKEKFANPTTIEICQERIQQYIERAKQAGIDVPKTIAFEPVPRARCDSIIIP